MHKIRRFFKRLTFAIIAVSLLFLTAWAYLTSNYAKPHIAHIVGENLKKILGSDVAIGNVSFVFPNTFTLDDIALSEAEAPWMTLKKLKLSIVPAEILKGKIIIKSLELDKAELLTSGKIFSRFDALSSSSSSPNVTIEHIILNHITIAPGFISHFNPYPEYFSKEIQLNANLYSHSGSWEGNLHLKTELETNFIEASTDFIWDPNKHLALNDLLISGYDSVAEGTLLYEQSTGWLEVNIKGTSSDISFLNRWLMKPMGGKADFTAQWLGTDNPSIQLHVESPQVMYQDISFKDVVLIASVSDIFKNPQANVHSSIGQIINKETVFKDITLATTIDSRHENWPIILTMGDIANITSFNTEGFWYFKNKTLQLSIQQLQGKIFEIPVTLQEHASMQLTPASLELSPFAFHVGEGSLKASLNYDASSLYSSLQFENMPLNLLPSSFTKLPLEGIISGQTIVNGSLEMPNIDSQWQFKEIKIDQKGFDKLPPISGQFKISLNEKGLNVSGNVVPFDYSPFQFETHLPITVKLDQPAFNINRTVPIFGKVTASGEIQKILQLFSKDAISLSGQINAALALSGTIDSPLINGIATISNGSFEILETGTVLHNVAGDFESSGFEVSLKKLSASDKYGHTLTGSGNLILDGANQFPYQLDLKMHELAVIDQDIITGILSGDLTLKGNADGASLTGSAIANSVNVTIPEQAAAVTNSVDVTYINQPEDEKVILADDDPPWPLNLDLKVTAPENVTVSSRDLSSEWKGNLAITGAATNPLFSGNFKITAGQYFFNGKNFDINQGFISLNGSLDNKSSTTLYVIASKDLGKVKVEVIAKGPVSNPEISFRSNPPLPQREILSWILFNRGTSEISPFQGSQLTESITNLKNSSSKGPDVLTKIRNSLGIDRLEISRDENSGSASIQVGKYISDNVFISVNKSNVNRIAVEAALMPNIKLQAQIGDDSQGQMLLKWKHDY